MDLEMELKLTRVADEFSSTDFQFFKDRAGPVFISTETDTMCFLTAHLKGYRKQNIKIEINEDGTQIIIGGEKAIQETVMVGWKLYKKETEIRRFRKAFKIPEGVILDKIKAKYNDDESILTISMPKKVKGIRGLNIEEVKEQELAREGSDSLEIVPDELPKQEDLIQETEPEYAEGSGLAEEKYSEVPDIARSDEPKEAGFNVVAPSEESLVKENEVDQNERLKKAEEDHEEAIEAVKSSADKVNEEGIAKSPESPIAADETPQGESVMDAQQLEKNEIRQCTDGSMERERDQTMHLDEDMNKNDQVDGKESDIQEEEESSLVEPPQEDRQSRIEEDRKKCTMCTPIIAGSALLLSLVVFVIQFIRTKSQQGKRKE